MSTTFQTLPWHDAQLLNISIDRRQPGDHDEIHMNIVWPSGSESICSFRDCYAAVLHMNFGVVAGEFISSARSSCDDPLLLSTRQKWAKVGVALDDLVCFEIETSSTNSTIKVLAKGFEVASGK